MEKKLVQNLIRNWMLGQNWSDQQLCSQLCICGFFSLLSKRKKKMLFLMETAKKWSNFANFVLDIPCLRKEHGIAIQ